MSLDVRRMLRSGGVFAFWGAVAALLWLPMAVERSVEATNYNDRIGTIPVEVSFSHNGHSTLETGILGSLYWEQTGAFGFGAMVRVTGTPQAGGTLASYVSPQFVQANAASISDPDELARAHGAELRSHLVRGVLQREAAAFLIGGLILTAIFRTRRPWPAAWTRRRTRITSALVLGGLLVGSCGLAIWLFDRWDGNAELVESHPMPGVPELSFSSPQALEIARQVRPFLEKNNERTREASRAYEEKAATTFAASLQRRAPGLAPRAGEVIVIAEADPQGSNVGTRVRRGMYQRLVDALGPDDFAMRTISGDLTSNGTVAESAFLEAEIAASADIETVVVKGDHDTETTLRQLDRTDARNPHLDLTEVGELNVIAGNDPAFKTLFGGLSVNETGISQREVGELVREQVDDADGDPVTVLLHQPAAAAGYLGIESLGDLPERSTQPTRPWDDGIADLPPGIINIGHLHDAEPPRVIWNTDGDDVTWTVVNQLGTSGGVEERPTFNRFSTPTSVPLKTLSLQLQYVDVESGLQTGWASIEVATNGTATVSGRADIGLPLRTDADE